MAIPNKTRFIGISQEVDLTERKSNSLNKLTEAYTIEDIRTSAGTDSVYDNLIAQGTDETTTLVLNYGVSIITTSTIDDYAAKLPQPITGRSTRVVNTSGFPVYVYPSNIGGQINDLPVDTPALLPADGKLYNFVCIENPLPGQWSVQLPSNVIIEVGTLEINHTNGVDSIVQGTTTAYPFPSPELSIMLAAGTGDIVVGSPTEQKSLNVPAMGVRSGYYTNILPTDIGGAGIPDQIDIQRVVFWGEEYNVSRSFGLDMAVLRGGIAGSTIGVITSGGLQPTVPTQIGATGTFAGQTPPLVPTTPLQYAGYQLGDSQGQQYTNFYWVYKVGIPASAATKLYKVQIFVEYTLI